MTPDKSVIEYMLNTKIVKIIEEIEKLDADSDDIDKVVLCVWRNEDKQYNFEVKAETWPRDKLPLCIGICDVQAQFKTLHKEESDFLFRC